jgi:hypothetical protein
MTEGLSHVCMHICALYAGGSWCASITSSYTSSRGTAIIASADCSVDVHVLHRSTHCRSERERNVQVCVCTFLA